MARKVFFSFHFERDVWRVGQVRNTWLTKPDRLSAGYWDKAGWEKVKTQSDDAIKRWIDSAMEGTSVTVVLIGAETSTRKWVDYEIERSRKRGNGMLGIYINNIKNRIGETDIRGSNPFDLWYTTESNGGRKYFSEIYNSYDWGNDNGYHNLGDWIDRAARDAGK